MYSTGKTANEPEVSLIGIIISLYSLKNEKTNNRSEVEISSNQLKSLFKTGQLNKKKKF